MNDKVEKKCEICHEYFEKPKSIPKKQWESRRFCSRACFGKWSSILQKKRPDRICENCKNTYSPKHFGAKYCNQKCARLRFKHRRGAKSHAWKGGRILHSSGYYMRRIYPEDRFYKELAGKKQYVMEHRIIMSEMLGRAMLPTETVHHKNGVRTDNRPENLELRAGKHGKGATKHCATCKCTE